MMYSKSAGIRKIIVFIPSIHAIFANEFSTGIKLVRVPTEEPPIIANKRSVYPIIA